MDRWIIILSKIFFMDLVNLAILSHPIAGRDLPEKGKGLGFGGDGGAAVFY